MSSEIVNDSHLVAEALAVAGQDERLRTLIFEGLREAESQAEDPATFREQVRWPLLLALLRDVKTHRVELEDGTLFDVGADSRIEKALLLSSVAHPDHVWEPQTTKLLIALAREASNVIVGGAYIGDQVVLMAKRTSATIHAFEPMAQAFARLLHHTKLNELDNVIGRQLCLWNSSEQKLRLDGHLALASSVTTDNGSTATGEIIPSISIDDYVQTEALPSVELIMLDTEGGEERVLHGASKTIARDAPNLVFEIHRNFVDWTNGLEQTSIVTFLTSQSYDIYAIRDFHNNYPTRGYPIEIVPLATVFVEGPPHGFNMLATKDRTLVNRLGLRIVENVSPKLLLEKDPALHFPLSTTS
jgi:FkbM family methyltransferase